MFALVAAVVFGVISVLTIGLILGFPLGEFSMGGQHKIFPPKLRVVAVFMLLIQIFAIIIVLQAGGYIPLWFSGKVTKIICSIYAGYLSMNMVMCFFSYSKKEKYVMTPLSAVVAICMWITAVQM